MTKAQVIEKFGEPEEYSWNDYSEIDGIYERYRYGEDCLLFVNEQESATRFQNFHH